MGDKPVIVVINMQNPCVPGEFEPVSDAIVVHSGVTAEAILDLLSGQFEPSGLLPMQLPENMETVEKQFEDTPFDMIPYRDSEGHVYDFGFGMNWNDVIHDRRTERFGRDVD